MTQTFWQTRILSWLDKRIPAQTQYQLDMSNIFIFPARFGLLFSVLCLALFLLGSNYSNNLMLLLCFFLVALFLINLSASYSNFSKIRVQIGRINPIFSGEDANIPLWFSHKSEQEDKLPYYGKIHISPYREKVDSSIDPQHFTNPALLSITGLSRGMHKLPRITIESFYPLGLYRCWTHLQFKGEVLVYPKPVPCSLNTVLAEDDGEQSELVSEESGIEDFDTLSAYQPGEPMHQIAWKQVAKGQGLVSKRFSGTSSKALWLSLQQMDSNNIEQALGKLCWSVLECNRQHMRFGLDLGSVKISPNSGVTHVEDCLKALALYPSAAKNTGNRS